MAEFDPISAFTASRPRYVQFCEELRVLIPKLLGNAGITPSLTEWRAKDIPSFIDKLKKLEKDVVSLDEITDLAGVRVIFYSPRDVEKAAGILREEFTVIDDELHGAPDLGVATFGYSSRHLIVRLGVNRCTLAEWQNFSDMYAEIQLRSVLQHAWASRSHTFDYKASQAAPEPIRRKLFRLAALLEIADDQFDELEDEARRTREGYAEQIKKGQPEASQLELTRDSVEVYLGLYPVLGGVSEVATRVGFDNSGLEGKTGSIDDLVEYARESGFKTLGEVVAYIDKAEAREEDLAAIFVEAKKLGFVPAALPFDVLVFLLSLDHSEAHGKLEGSSYQEAMKRAVGVVRARRAEEAR